ncbi:hypothetical protein U8D42_03230 [Mycobacterium europaeum]|uniref:hypothetical protein n=1 Tax=Mycobacterium europaeum TaxID=761804 RepID=UPI002ADF06F2|nr:hypothetical protein [Mycobacterium europaeum]MEA1159429.1 hypothetical protein [Mycobacterium europaeum]
MSDEKTITVYCAAQSHQRWERTYFRHGDDDFWRPDTWDRIDGRAKKSRRGGGMEFIDAAGRVVPLWATGRASGGFEPQGINRLIADLDRANQVAGRSDNEFGRRYLIRCPLCGDGFHRSGSQVDAQFDLLWEKRELWENGLPQVSIDDLRTIRKPRGLS